MENEAKVELISFTQNALEILILTKSGRLAAGSTLDDIMSWSEEKKMEELSYMKNTIKTSFEFVDYIIHISNVSRAFTHQLVRTRTASFQQEAMRVVDASEAGCLTTIEDPIYHNTIKQSFKGYASLKKRGYPVQDCRAVLPTGVYTSIYIKANLRTLAQMAETRLCKRAEGEYQAVFKKMVSTIIKVHPWAADMLEVYCVKHGLCQFPRYDKCPIQRMTLNSGVDIIRPQIRKAWEKCNHVANPVAVDGKTM